MGVAQLQILGTAVRVFAWPWRTLLNRLTGGHDRALALVQEEIGRKEMGNEGLRPG